MPTSSTPNDMMASLESLLDQGANAVPGEAVRLSPRIRRVLAANPGPFTLHGTGTYLVGNEEVAVIDPGPLIDSHVDSILRAVGRGRITHIFITHTHIDHSPAAEPLRQETQAPTFGFGPHRGGSAGADDEGGDTDFQPEHRLTDGDTIQGKDWKLSVLHTPGHTSNHLCFWLAEENLVFTGDHVMGWSSTVVSPPDGNMTDYLASLRHLREVNADVLLPTHGPAIREPNVFIDALLAHRERRIEEVLASLASGSREIPEIVVERYPGLDPALRAAAGRSVLASLLHLESKSRVIAEGGVWRLRQTS